MSMDVSVRGSGGVIILANIGISTGRVPTGVPD